MIVELLEKAIAENHYKKEKEHPRDYSVVHPSALFGCLRLQAYEMAGYDLGEPSVKLMSIFRDGHAFHQTAQDDLVKLGVSKPEWVEIHVEDLWKIEGHADQLIEIDGELILLDYKSVGGDPEEWYGNKKWKEITTNPPLKYITQLQVYMGALRKKGYQIERAFLVFKRKADGELAEYEVRFDEMLYEMALERARQLCEYIENNTLPEREGTDPNKAPCKFCDGRKICWSEEW